MPDDDEVVELCIAVICNTCHAHCGKDLGHTDGHKAKSCGH